MSRLTTVNSNYFETSNLNGTVVKFYQYSKTFFCKDIPNLYK